MNLQESRTIVVDDEPNAAHLLQSILSAFPIFGNISVFTNVTMAFNTIIEQKPAFLFLDVQMPELTGLQLAEKIKPHTSNTKVIYVTAYDKYALEALRQNAFDYLLKPVDKVELVRLVDKLLMTKKKDTTPKPNNHLLIHNLEGIYQVQTDEIVYLEADGSYTKVVLKNGKQILATVNMGKILPSVPQEQFIRISRKHLVNREYTTFYHSKEKYVRLETPGKEYQLEVTIKVHDIKQLLGK
jgi:DNA-binding LytR/AlgR family response regulator